MKNYFCSLLCLFFFCACEQEDIDQGGLNITYKKSINKEKGIDDTTPNIPSLSVFPNPFKDSVSFKISDESENIELFISDGKGKSKIIKITDDAFTLDFSQEKDGAYYYEMRIDDFTFFDHLIKQ